MNTETTQAPQDMNDILQLPYDHICATLIENAPLLAEAKACYEELRAIQRDYTGARELVGRGLRIGDKVRLTPFGGRPFLAAVVAAEWSCLYFRKLDKQGQPSGERVSDLMWESIEKAEQ